jgi:hypothetical protein
MSLFDDFVASAKAFLDAREAEVAVLRADLESARTRADSVEAEKVALEARIVELEASIQKLQARIAELEAVPTTPTPPPTPTTPTPVPGTPDEFYGPTGEWPVELAWAHDDNVTVVKVEPTWAAIVAAEKANTSKPTILAVKPGVLTGFGAGSTVKAVLSGIRRADNAPLLIMAAEGLGSVTTTASWRLDKLRNVGFAHFDLWPFGFVTTDCEKFVFARSTTKPANITTSTLSSGITFHELVRLEATNEDADAWGWRDNGTKTPVTEDITVRGCYVPGTYKAAGSSAHCDTIQISGNGAFRRIVFDLSLVAASTNHAFITTDYTDDVLIRRTAIIGGTPRKQRWPEDATRAASEGGIAINSRPTNIRAEDSLITGKVVPVMAVTRPRSAANLNAKWWEEHAPQPTRDTLAKLWAKNSPI